MRNLTPSVFAVLGLAGACTSPPPPAPEVASAPEPTTETSSPAVAPVVSVMDFKNATLEVDASHVVNRFKPLHVFGNNVPAWVNPVPVKGKIEAAGNYLLRIPGGSWGDVYHWNSKGKVDAKGQWVPSATEYEPSKLEIEYTGKYFSSRAGDGNDKTFWMSHPETDAPNGQWLYMDFGAAREVDEVTITWGNVPDKAMPYAKKFSIQAWNPAEGRQWMVYGAEKSAWLDLKPGLTGTGGIQKVGLPKTKTQYLRLLLQESSQGKKGVYSIAEYRASLDGKPIALASPSACVASSSAVATSGLDTRKIFGFEEYMTFLGSFTPKKAVPLVIVNFGSGTPQEAAAWVHYANKVKSYGIKYWEIGNELGGHWEAGGPLNSRDYARRYIQFYEAMKKEDPTISIVAQTGVSDPSELYDGVLALQSFVERLAQDKKEKYLDAFSVHQYPNWGQPVAELLNSPKGGMKELASSIEQQLSKWPSLSDVPVWISEFNTSDHVVPIDISVRLDNGLWLAQYLGEFIRNFGPRGYATLWNVMNGGNATQDPKGGDHGYLQTEEGPFQHQERADYWTMKLMAATWAMPGDDRDHQLVESESAQAYLASYAVVRPDGELGLLVVNKDKKSSYRTTLHIKGFQPLGGAQGWVLDSSTYDWKTDAVPYHADPSKPPAAATVTVGAEGAEFTFPAYSVSVLRFKKKA